MEAPNLPVSKAYYPSATLLVNVVLLPPDTKHLCILSTFAENLDFAYLLIRATLEGVAALEIGTSNIEQISVAAKHRNG